MGTVTKGGISRIREVGDDLHPQRVRGSNARSSLPIHLIFPISQIPDNSGKERVFPSIRKLAAGIGGLGRQYIFRKSLNFESKEKVFRRDQRQAHDNKNENFSQKRKTPGTQILSVPGEK